MFNQLLGSDLDQQLEQPQLPLQQLLIHQLKSDFAGSRNADRNMELLQFPACDSGEESKALHAAGKVHEAW